MSYAIIGFGKIGQALAHAFARRNIEVAVASRRPARGPRSAGPGDRPEGRRPVPAGGAQGRYDLPGYQVRVAPGPRQGAAELGRQDPRRRDQLPGPLEEMDGLLSSAFVAKALCRRQGGQGVQPPWRDGSGDGPGRRGRPSGGVPVERRRGRLPHPWRPWPNSSASPPSIWGVSTRAARWFTPAAPPGAR